MSVTMLYNDPHPVHEKMADAIGAELKPAASALSRLVRPFIDEYDTLILEGGMPIAEGMLLKQLGNVDKVVMLAADETLHNLDEGLDYYRNIETKIHSAALSHLDGIITVSERDAERAKRMTDVPVMTAEPFILDERAEALDNHSRGKRVNTVLTVGENRPSMNQGELIRACNRTNMDLTIAGSGTETWVDGEGFVSDERLEWLLSRSSVFCFPALAGAHPVSVLEGMYAGSIPIVSDQVGVAPLVAELDEHLVCGTDADSIVESIAYFDDLESGELTDLRNRARNIARRFREKEGVRRFSRVWSEMEAAI